MKKKNYRYTYVIGDIHGVIYVFKELEKLIEKIHMY